MPIKPKAELSLSNGEHLLITCTGVKGKVGVTSNWYVLVTSEGKPLLLKQMAKRQK